MSLKKLGRYDIVKPLGKGAMGLVYEAHDPHIKRAVAIKTIRIDQLSEDMAAEYESRFRSETQAGGRLQHPNIIGVYDAGRDQGLAFMVMELVRGGDLRQQLDQGRRLTFERSMSIMKELLSALSFAHEQGIIHRDIKPANVMLDPNGRVKLGDFGVARITDGGEATRTQGSMVGTLKYMSPEQVIGAKVDARTDLFAAGVVLYQLVTGTKPFEGLSDFAIMQAIAQQDPPPPSSLNLSLPAGLDGVVFKALAKNRDNRYASAKDFSLALRSVMQQMAALATTELQSPAWPPSAPRAAAGTPQPEAGASGAQGVDTQPSGSSLTSPSAVSQEMELLYWKDIQDSADPEDFAGFLSQFPVGVYAGLAQRRLRRLASATSERTDSQSVAGPSVSSMQVRLSEASASTGMHGSATAQLSPALAPAAADVDASVPLTGTGIESDREPFESTRVAPPPASATPAIDQARAARRAQASREEDERNALQARQLAELRWIGPLRAAASPPEPVASDLPASPREPEVAGAPALQADPATTSEPAFAHAEAGPPPSPPAVVGVAVAVGVANSNANSNANAIAGRAVKVRSVAVVAVVAIAAAVALLGGGAWLVLRDRGQPALEATPVSVPATALPDPTAVVAPAAPDALPPARPESPSIAATPEITEPAASAAPASFPPDTGPTLAQARAQERADLGTAVASYEEIANGIDRKAAAGAARRLWELNRDGGKGMVSNPEQAQRWYDKARKLGARLPVWPAVPTASAPLATTSIASPAPAATASAAAPLATVKATPAELYERGKKLEARSPRLAEAAYRDAAQQGHGASQKRMWELLSGSGRAADAGRYQKDAWDQHVPGVPKPKDSPPP